MPRKTTAPDAKWNPWLRRSRIHKKAGPRPNDGQCDTPADPDGDRRMKMTAFDHLPPAIREVLFEGGSGENPHTLRCLLEAGIETEKRMLANLRRAYGNKK